MQRNTKFAKESAVAEPGTGRAHMGSAGMSKSGEAAAREQQSERGLAAGVVRVGLSLMPWLIIGGLLWAGIFIKPQPVGSTVQPPVIERDDAFFGITAIDSKLLWAAGNYGKIIHSADGGASWNGQSTNTARHLQDVSAWDAKKLVAVGNGGSILVTDDGGANWALRRPDFLPTVNDKLLRVKAYAGGQAWAVGEMGALLSSSDYGHTWERRRGEQDTAFNDVVMVDESTGWVVGEAGSMLRTMDGGKNWAVVEPIVKSSLMAVAFRDVRNGVAVGLEGVILVTRDGGKSWTRATAARSGSDAAIKLHFYDVTWDPANSRWVVVGDQGVYATSDADASAWQVERLGAGELGWHTRIIADNAGFYVAGANLGAWSGRENGWRRFSAKQ